MVPFLFKSNEKNNLPSLKFFPQTMRAKAAKIKWGQILSCIQWFNCHRLNHMEDNTKIMWGKTLILVNDSRYAHKKHSVFKYYGIIFICRVQCLWIIKILLVCWDIITWVMKNYVITWVMNYIITWVMNLCGKGNPRNPWTLIPHEQWWFHSTSARGIDRDIHFTLFVWPEAWKKRTTHARSVC